jgi:hypothetical protein
MVGVFSTMRSKRRERAETQATTPLITRRVAARGDRPQRVVVADEAFCTALLMTSRTMRSKGDIWPSCRLPASRNATSRKP